SKISGIAVDNVGRIYVLDIKEAQIKVFNKEGTYIKTLGKKGQGPGEMVSPFSICITRKDEIFVQDLNAHRILLLSLEGALIKTISTAELLLIGSVMDSRENIIGLVGISGPERQIFELMKFDSNLNPLFNFCSASRPSSMARPPYHPFNPEPAWTLTRGDAVIFGYTEDYELKLFDSNGKLVRKITKDYEPVKITDDEIEDMRKKMPGPMASELPKHHTAYQDFSADEEGHIFVRTWEKADDRQRCYFDVFDADGRYITKAIVNGQPRVWKKGHLCTLEEDREGYPVVRRYKVFWKYPNGDN
ncbi:MAG: 6-bladed beta-propeller, partial [Acidobacteriota bacterium]